MIRCYILKVKTLLLLLLFSSQSVLAKVTWTVEQLPQMYHLSAELKSTPKNESEVKQMELKAHALIDSLSLKIRELNLKQSNVPFFKFDLSTSEMLEVGIPVEGKEADLRKLTSYPSGKFLVAVYEGEIAPMVSPFADLKKVMATKSLKPRGEYALLFKSSALPRKKGRMQICIPVQ